MTQEFLQGEADPLDQSVTVSVHQHKTFAMYSAAPVQFAANLHAVVTTYVEKIRPCLKPKSSYLFVNASGNQIQSSNAPRIMRDYYAKTGCQGRVGFSLIRKFTVMNVKILCPELSASFAKKMMHSENTQSKYYDVTNKKNAPMETFTQTQLK